MACVEVESPKEVHPRLVLRGRTAVHPNFQLPRFSSLKIGTHPIFLLLRFGNMGCVPIFNLVFKETAEGINLNHSSVVG